MTAKISTCLTRKHLLEEEEEQIANGGRVVIGSKTRRGRGAPERCWECEKMAGLGMSFTLKDGKVIAYFEREKI